MKRYSASFFYGICCHVYAAEPPIILIYRFFDDKFIAICTLLIAVMFVVNITYWILPSLIAVVSGGAFVKLPYAELNANTSAWAYTLEKLLLQ